ncbi:MAG: helix-turn-helix transcriptional regulator [Spirochaetaceae bacterium]|jgi:transcriptional regulator with XRE-family HTH domain|nr:helix-turn-helix transcriptional regulator [Spirochaetaceae bacterium]
MASLRQVLATNLKTYRKELGFSQEKLAELVGTASNYIAMIEGERRFPTDTMLEKIAKAMNKEPVELFSENPINFEWRKELLTDLGQVIDKKLKEITCPHTQVNPANLA